MIHVHVGLSRMVGDFIMLLRMVRIWIVYLWNFPFNISGPKLTAGNWNCGQGRDCCTSHYMKNTIQLPCWDHKDRRVWCLLNFIPESLTCSVAVTWLLSLNIPVFFPLKNIHTCCFFAWSRLPSLHLADIFLSFRFSLKHLSRKLLLVKRNGTGLPTPPAVILYLFPVLFFLWVGAI